MASAEGGVEIEEVAKATPEAIHRVAAHPLLGLLDYQARELAFAVGLAGPHLARLRQDRQGPRRDDEGQRRRPRRGQPAGDHPRERRRGPRRAPRLPRRQDHPRRLGAAAPPRPREAARPRRGGPGRRRGPPLRHQLHPPRRVDRLHGQRRRPGDDDDGPRQAGRRRSRPTSSTSAAAPRPTGWRPRCA